MQFNDSGVKTYASTAALAKHRLVKKSGASVEYNTASDRPVGSTLNPSFNAEEPVPVRLTNCPGTFLATASEAIGLNGDCFAAADGKVASTGTVLVGTAEIAATADGDVIEVMPPSASE